jgi:ketosteroid isomerase-like protein
MSQAAKIPPKALEAGLTSEECDFFKARVIDYHAAWSPGRETFDIRKTEPYYSKSSELTAYDVVDTNGVIKGWENYKAELLQIMQGWLDFNISLTKPDVEVFRHGDIVWTTSTFQIKGMLQNGQSLEAIGRTSLVWKHQDDGNWLIVHEHSSVPISD